MIPNESFVRGVHEYQVEALKAFDSGDYRYFSLEWHRRARKTTLAINLLVRECCKNPNTKYVYVAPTMVMARNIVWDDPNMLMAALPDKEEMGWKTTDQKMLVKFANGSMLKIGGSDNPDSLRGIDAVGVVFDEWSLIKEATWTEIFRPIMAGDLRQEQLDAGMSRWAMFRWAMFLYTPKGINHATIQFDKACQLEQGKTLPECGSADGTLDGWFVSRLDGEKSGIMKPSELALAKNDMPTTYYDQEIRCSRITEEERTLITTAMLQKLNDIDWESQRAGNIEIRRIVAIDPAFGGDKCVIIGIENGRILSIRTMSPYMTNDIVAEAKSIAALIDTKNFVVDCIGNGKGVSDGLSSDVAGYNVVYFDSSEQATDDRFRNMKAEAWFMVAEKIKRQDVEPIEDGELLRQLPTAASYKVLAQGRIIMRPKLEVKKILGCSPDYADAFVMGMYAIDNVYPESEIVNGNVSHGVDIPSYLKVHV